MSKINGTTMLVYCDGTLVAAQKNVTVNWETDLLETSDKDSTGWATHIKGTRRATVDFEALYETSGFSTEESIAYILNRTSCVLVIDGTGVPIVGEARVKNISLNAVNEGVASFSGQFVADGGLWMLTGAFANLMTDPDGTSSDYDTLTISGISITSAINLGGDATAASNTFSVTNAAEYKVITYLTLNSGQAPSCQFNTGVTGASNAVAFTAGVNILTLTATTSATVRIHIYNTSAANWAMSNIYIFKV